MRSAQQLSSHGGTGENLQTSGLRGLVARLCPNEPWFSHVSRLAGNLAKHSSAQWGTATSKKCQAYSARGWPVLWGRGRAEKPSRAPRDMGEVAGSHSRALKGAEASLDGAAAHCYSTQPSAAAKLRLICSALRNPKPSFGAEQTGFLGSHPCAS